MAIPTYGPLAKSPQDALRAFLGRGQPAPTQTNDPTTLAVPDSGSFTAPAAESPAPGQFTDFKQGLKPTQPATESNADGTFTVRGNSRTDYFTPGGQDMLKRQNDAYGRDVQQDQQHQELVDFFNPQNQQKIQQEFGQKYDLATAPARIAGQSAQEVQRLKNRGDVDLQNAQTQQGKDAIAAFQSSSGGDSGGGMAPVTLKPSINPKGQVSFTSQAVPAQTLQQQHAAQMGLEHYGDFRQAVDDLTKAGLVGPVAGRAADYLTTSGLDKALMSPDQARAFANFKAQTSLIKSNMAMVHGGARGGGSPEIAKRFDTLMSTHQSPEGLKGALDAFETWLKTYANAKDSSEMDAADAGLGLTPARAAQPAYLSGPGTEPPQ